MKIKFIGAIMPRDRRSLAAQTLVAFFLNCAASDRGAVAQSIPGPDGDPGQRAAWAHSLPRLNARLVAKNIPGASALAEVGVFLNDPAACARPIPTKFPDFTKPGAELDPTRLLVGSRSNFGAPLAPNAGREGSVLSIDPTGPNVLNVPQNFAQSDGQASALGGNVQMFSANSPHFLNGFNNSNAITKDYAGVSNPLGLSNNNAFGRIWPANAPFRLNGLGSSSILDPTGLPLQGPPNIKIGGVYVGAMTDRDQVTSPPQPQIIPGALNTAAVGTALLGPSPDNSCRAVFAVVTADGAIVQEHTQKGLDGLAPRGTVGPLLGHRWREGEAGADPRLGVLLNPYVQTLSSNVVLQLFVSEPFANDIAAINLIVRGPNGSQVFASSAIKRISSRVFNQPVDLAPVKIDTDDIKWASNTTLDDGSDIYVANRGDNTIVRMKQDGTIIAVRQVAFGGQAFEEARINGIATSRDGKTIYATFVSDDGQGGVLAMPTF
jgi:hypothetical protein